MRFHGSPRLDSRQGVLEGKDSDTYVKMSFPPPP